MHEELGWNFRMTNLQAAIGLAQLEKIDEKILKKRQIGEFYNNALSEIKGLILPPEKKDYASSIYWVYGILADKKSGKSGQWWREQLAKMGVGTRPFFYPMHKQPIFRKMGLFQKCQLPRSEYLYEHGFYIPSGLGISEDDMKRVVKAVKTCAVI